MLFIIGSFHGTCFLQPLLRSALYASGFFKASNFPKVLCVLITNFPSIAPLNMNLCGRPCFTLTFTDIVVRFDFKGMLISYLTENSNISSYFLNIRSCHSHVVVFVARVHLYV